MGTIAVPAQYAAKYTPFLISVLRTHCPPNTKFAVGMGTSIAESRNKAIKEMAGDWIWFIDDDNFWHPEMLIDLLKHNVDVVVPLSLRKSPPFHPLAYSKIDENGDYVPIELEDEGLTEVYAAGTGGMLIRRHVLEAMGYPWFEYGRTHPAATGEDLFFCHKARQQGFKIYCDTSLKMGHQHLVNIFPHKNDGQWGALFDIEGFRIFSPHE